MDQKWGISGYSLRNAQDRIREAEKLSARATIVLNRSIILKVCDVRGR